MADKEVAAFNDKLGAIAASGLVSAAIALGDSLGLFSALAEVGSEENPATAELVANQVNCKPRYVREWLSMMACSDIIQVNKEEKFWIKKQLLPTLTDVNVNRVMNNHLPVFLKGFDKLKDVFTKDGPCGLKYSDFTDFYRVMEQWSKAMHEEHLISSLIPKMSPDLHDRLKNGDMMALDVGCGYGFHCALLAEEYPNSHFTGIDIVSDAILLANEKRKHDGKPFDNLAFIQMNAGKMDADWNDKYDVVFIFDACHDQMRPDLCLKEIHRVLKPGGIFAMLEVVGTSNVCEDKAKLGAMAAMMYGCSMFHCLPVGNNSEDALGLGAMWGERRARDLLKQSGFDDVKIIQTPEFAINQLYLCKK